MGGILSAIEFLKAQIGETDGHEASLEFDVQRPCREMRNVVGRSVQRGFPRPSDCGTGGSRVEFC
jgi:hypothetical protein